MSFSIRKIGMLKMPKIAMLSTLDVETRVAALKKEYEEALSQLKDLREQQRLVQAQRLLDAMDKKGKSFEEVLRLVNL